MAKDAKTMKKIRTKTSEKLNNLTVLFLVGCLLETYLLVIYRLYTRGTGLQLVAVYNLLTYMPYAGAALAVLGAALIRPMRKRRINWGFWILGVGLFLILSSVFSVQIYGAGSVLFCAVVPVIMLLAVVYTLCSGEFFWVAVSLVLSIGALWIWRKCYAFSQRQIIGYATMAAVLLALAVITVLTVQAAKNKGAVTVFGQKRQMLSAYSDKRVLYCIYALCGAALALSLLIGSLAFYATLLLAVVLFAAAIYFTVKSI